MMKMGNTSKTANNFRVQGYAKMETTTFDHLNVLHRQTCKVVVDENIRLNKQKILEAAQRAPSTDNCQPWTFKWENNLLFIYHNADRAKHYFNVQNAASLLTLGCVVESIHLAAIEQKCAIHCSYFDKSDNDLSHPWATIQFNSKANAVDSQLYKNLYKYINERYTYREKFTKSDVGTTILNNKQQLIGDMVSTNFYITEEKSNELTNYLIECDSFIWSKLKGTEDLLNSIRFTQKEYEKSNDGMFWKHLGINSLEKIVLKLLSLKPKLIKYFNLFGFRRILKKSIGQNILTSSGFLCVTVNNNNSSSIIEAGRLAMRCWLQLTSEGFSVQPQLGCSLNSYSAQQNLLPADFSPAEKKYFISGNAILQNNFNTNTQPIWLFRYGMPSQKGKNVTIRKPISELIIN